VVKSDIKYFVGVALILITGILHIAFFDNNDKYDVYLLYSNQRYLTNILYDISVLTEFSVLTYFLVNLNKKWFRPLFIFSLLQWISYFLVYRQSWTLIGLPLLIILYYYEFRVKKGNIENKWIKQ